MTAIARELGTTAWPQWWRWTVIAAATLTLCSCRATPPCPAVAHHPAHTAPGGAPMLPVAAPGAIPPGMMAPGYVHAAHFARPISEDCLACGPAPVDCPPCGPIGQPTCCGPCTNYWRARPIGYGEWVCDGGDHGVGVAVSPDWQVFGLNPEDTVAHYDTLDGRTLVEPSNCVCIYAPRFAATRSLTRVVASEYVASPGATIVPEMANKIDDLQIPTSALQRVPPQGHVAALPPSAYIGRLGEHVVSRELLPHGNRNPALPIAILENLHRAELKLGEMPRLAACIDAAITWTHDLGVQVIVEEQQVALTVVDRKPQAITFSQPLGDPKLRVCKVASTQFAQPGDIIEFAIRVDNVGSQPVGNIVLIDNLTTRLEYVEGSAQASVEGQFRAEPNPGESLTLRWELAEPIAAGDGAVVVFKCRVR